ERGKHDFIGIREARFLASERPDANTLLDARAAILHDAVLEGPRFLARQLEVDVREIYGVPEYLPKHLIEPRVIEAARTQDEVARNAERVVSHFLRVHAGRRAGLQHAMLERGEFFADSSLGGQIDVSDHDTAPARQPRQDPTPVVDDHAVSVSLAPVCVKA